MLSILLSLLPALTLAPQEAETVPMVPLVLGGDWEAYGLRQLHRLDPLRPIPLFPSVFKPKERPMDGVLPPNYRPQPSKPPIDRKQEIMRRVPAGLPKAKADSWVGRFADEATRMEAFRSLDPAIVDSLAAADRSYRRGELPSAIEACYRALEAAPDLPPALSILGTTYFRLQRYGDTVTCFERLLLVAPDELWRTQALGHAYYSLGMYERALDHYSRVVATERAGIDALRGRGLSELKLGLDERGLATLEAVLKRDPEHADALEALARARFERGELDLALPLAERARSLTPYTPRPWYLLTQIYLELGRDADAHQAQYRWREVDRLVQELRRLEAEEELQPGELELSRAIVGKRFELGDLDGASSAAMRGLGRAKQGSPEALRLALDTADTLARLGANQWSDRWAERVTSAFANERAAWTWAIEYWGTRKDRVRQIEAQRRLQMLVAAESAEIPQDKR